MDTYGTISLLYILFIWFVIIHTFEEIAQGVVNLKLGPIKLSQRKYYFGAGLITSLNLGTLALLFTGNRIGLYLGVFTSLVFGVLQALMHFIGFLKAGRKPKDLGVGFYTSLPLAVVGAVLLVQVLSAI